MPMRMRASRPISCILSVVAALVVASCAAALSPSPSPPASPSPSASASASAAMTASAEPSATASPTLTPTPPPTGPVAFTTPVPAGATTAWTGITWRKLSAADPRNDVRSVVRWNGGFVAVGHPVAQGGTSRTPLWTSSDGATWHSLPAATLGPATVVLGLQAIPTGLVALTVQGGASSCDAGDLERLGVACLTLAAPFQTWTSPDAERWTAQPAPDLPLAAGSEAAGDPPRLVAGAGGLLIVAWDRSQPEGGLMPDGLAMAGNAALPAASDSYATQALGVCRLARSVDGITWEVLPADTFAAGFVCTDIAPLGTGLVAIGQPAESRASALWSADLRSWTTTAELASSDPSDPGALASDLVVGSGGVIATGGVSAAPGRALWWSSTDGRSWKAVLDFRPLGFWKGPVGGPDYYPNGVLIGDGERMVALRSGTDAAGWTSFDGRSWSKLTLNGAATPPEWQVYRTVPMPIGLLMIGQNGSAWFGTPTTR